MKSPARTFPWTVIIGLILLFLTLALAFLLVNIGRLKAAPPLPMLEKVGDFSLTNELGAPVSLADLKGHVWVADIIFTRCPGPCLKMTRQMKEIETALPPSSKTRLVSLTTDPDFDTPEILTKYAERFHADTNRWMFLTGTKKEIRNLAIDSLKLTAVEKTPEERQSENDLWVHSTIFVVVDKHGNLRAIVQTTGPEVNWPQSKRKLLADVKQLERES